MYPATLGSKAVGKPETGPNKWRMQLSGLLYKREEGHYNQPREEMAAVPFLPSSFLPIGGGG
jgi:hypothetical protein